MPCRAADKLGQGRIGRNRLGRLGCLSCPSPSHPRHVHREHAQAEHGYKLYRTHRAIGALVLRAMNDVARGLGMVRASFMDWHVCGNRHELPSGSTCRLDPLRFQRRLRWPLVNQLSNQSSWVGRLDLTRLRTCASIPELPDVASIIISFALSPDVTRRAQWAIVTDVHVKDRQWCMTGQTRPW